MATSATRSTTNATALPKSTTSSPGDIKKTLPNLEDLKSEEAHSVPESQKSPPRSDAAPPASKVDERNNNEDIKNNTTTAQPLAPPPKPSLQTTSEGPDYFGGGSTSHGGSHFSLEPNPFEQSFGNPSSEPPGRFPGLPSVASLTSPAPLGVSGTPGWQLGNSLRSGPLSPAMLPGPTGGTGYFDEQFRQSFPTPNESSLRTGLTPGGGGSMFPAPSPNSQAIFNSMQSGLQTPGTIDFQRSAMNAAARSKQENTIHNQTMGPTPQGINKQDYQPAQQAAMGHQDPFNHPDRDAVNSLYMLARNGDRSTNQFAVPNQPPGLMNNSQAPQRAGQQQQDTSPTAGRGPKQSMGSIDGSMVEDHGEYDGSDGSLDKPAAKTGKGKKGSAGKAAPNASSRRKAEEMAGKGSANKRSKLNNGSAAMAAMMMDEELGDSDEDIKDEIDTHPNGRKMTDEEKRKNFLERNRVAALKCRQRKKQWLANLQAKVEIFTSENDALNAQNSQLREEVNELRHMLSQHDKCDVTQQGPMQRGSMSQGMGGDLNANAYGMMQHGGQHMTQQMMQMHPGQGMQRN